MKRTNKYLTYILITTAVITAYYYVAICDFIDLDDRFFITENEFINKGFTKEGFIWAFTSMAPWNPLSWLTHMLDVQLFGINPGLHHGTNLFFHVVGSLLLLLVFQRMTGQFWKSAFLASLFALHPINVESVAWLAERRNVLSFVFLMLTLLSYVSYARKPAVHRYFLVISFFVLGLMAKQMLVTIPFALLLLDYWPLRRFSSAPSAANKTGPVQGTAMDEFPKMKAHLLVIEKVPLMALSAFTVYILTFTIRHAFSNVISLDTSPMDLRIANAVISYARYLGKLVWPWDLAVFYPYPSSMYPIWMIAGSVLLLSLVTLAALWQMKRRPYLVVGWFWFLGTLVTAIGIVQAGQWPAMADRYAYISFIGLFMIISWGIPDLLSVLRCRYGKTLLQYGGIFILVILTGLTWRQVHFWKDSITLFEHSVQITKDNYLHNNLGAALFKKGRVEDAIAHYQEVLKINPSHAEARYNLGAAYLSLGKAEEATEYFEEVLRVFPGDSESYMNLGVIAAMRGDYALAEARLLDALNTDPENAQAYFFLGGVFLNRGDAEKALLNYEQALHTHPLYAEAHYGKGVVLVRLGKINAAMAAFAEALRINPQYADAHFNLGVALDKKNRLREAVDHYERALQINAGYVQARENLKDALKRMAKIDEAIQSIREGMETHSTNPEMLTRLGDLHRLKGDLEGAAQLYRAALVLQPESREALRKAAVLFFELGLFEQSLGCFHKLEQSMPDDQDLRYNMACVYARLNRADDAIMCLKQAIERGFKNWDLMGNDEDLDGIRQSASFQELINGIRAVKQSQSEYSYKNASV